MKLYKNAIILVVVLAVLIGAYLFLSSRDPASGTDETETNDELVIFDFGSDELVKITVDNEGERFVMEKTETDWELKEPADLKANYGSLSSIGYNVTSLRANKIIEEDAQDLAQYSLDNPATITASLKDGSEKTLLIGGLVPTRDAYYAKTGDSGRVYTISQYTAETLKITKNAIRDKQLFSFEIEDVTALGMERNGQLIFTSRKSGEVDWEITEPIRGNANLTAIDPMIAAVTELSVSEFVEEEPADLEKYGLGDPSYVIDVQTSTAKQKLLLGKEQQGAVFYAKLADSNEVFTISGSGLTFLDKPLKEIVEVFAYIVNINDVNRIEVEIDGRIDKIEIQTDEEDSDNDKFFLNGRDASVRDDRDKQYFRTYYQALIGVVLNEVEPGAVPSGEAEITFTYYLKKDPGTMKVEFIPKDDRLYYVNRNGDYTGIVVEKRQFDKEEGVRETYKKLLELMDNQKSE